MSYVPATLSDLVQDVRRTLGDEAKLHWTDEAVAQAIKAAVDQLAIELKLPRATVVGVVALGENGIVADFGLGVLSVALEA